MTLILFILILQLNKKNLYLNYFAFKSFDFERTWWRLFQKRVVRATFNIYVIIIIII